MNEADWKDLAGEAAGAIAEFGMTCTLRKQGAKTGPANAPTFGEPTEYAITAVDLDDFAQYRPGTMVLSEAKKLMVAINDLVPAPAPGDTVVVKGKAHEVAKFSALSPAGADVFWTVELKR